jgi:hypothetical protein
LNYQFSFYMLCVLLCIDTLWVITKYKNRCWTSVTSENLDHAAVHFRIFYITAYFPYFPLCGRPGIDGTVTLEWIFRELWWENVNWIYVSG